MFLSINVVLFHIYHDDLNIDLKRVNFNRLSNFVIDLSEKNQKDLFKFHKKINGQINLSAEKIGIKILWEGQGLDEKGYDENTGKCIVAVHSRYIRPSDVNSLLGDSTKARNKLGWKPKTSFDELVSEMVESSMREADKELKLKSIE